MKDRTFHVISYMWIRFWEKSGYWNEIDKISECLYISSIPLRESEKNLMDKISSDGAPLMLVVSAVEDYEISETLPFMDPTRKEEWENKFHVHHNQAKLKDFASGEGSNLEDIAKIVMNIQRHREDKQAVLVHCKAGRTRSAMITACVLAIYDLGIKLENAKKTPRQLIDMAVELIQQKRPQVKVHDDVRETGAKIVQVVRGLLAKSPSPVPGMLDEKKEMKVALPAKGLLLDKVNELFSNSELNFKDEILKKDACHNLYTHRNILLEEAWIFRKPKRAGHIKKIFDNLNEVKDCGWLKELMFESGPFSDFINADPSVPDKEKAKNERRELIEKLKSTVQDLICKKLDCTPDELSKSLKKQLQPS